ncbi:Glycosyltransferase involved in cell wall bisynthesis [Quadrisphaera granulorum]|uniref:Glycosyltransferase involved in cell wall biosynthesis n=1 Tax=Quadrisphaera granulorum TaxID=317664 RepID=A0A316A4J7_9ACTN|nr:glycosyltransferase involved in cell wall biosynthesis [Quadrisphaera granulorum]SZE97655.1 Glycosyltransferase involved in cell wall bisynthesis [Quadrisphaera granulorum]
MLLVIGQGAEDAEDELGALIAAATATTMIGFDPVAARTTTSMRRPRHVVTWLVAEYQPDMIVVIDDHPGSGSVTLPTSHDAVHVTRQVALAVLSCIEKGNLEGPARPISEVGAARTDDSDTSNAAAVLLRWHRNAPMPRPQVTDRSPRVTMLVCVYNQEPYLHATLQSALADTYDDYEVLVLDDGSTDASPSIIQQYSGNPRLVSVRQENLGGTGRMDLVINRGLRAARGELIAMMGGDDVSLPHRLTAQVAAFDEDPGLGVCHGGGYFIDASGERQGSFSLSVPYDELSFLRDMQRVNLVSHPSVMHSRASLETVGWYEEGVACDYHWWLKAGGRIRFRYLPQRLVEYRIHDRSLSTTAEGMARCGLEARRHRRLVAERRDLDDYFPELRGRTESGLWHDAALELGNRLISADPVLAAHFYQLGAEARQSHRASYNLAVAHHLAGERDDAIAAAALAAAGSTRGASLHDALRRGAVADVDLFAPDSDFSQELGAARAGLGTDKRMWDGSFVSVASAYVALPYGQDAQNRQALQAWSRHTTATSPVRWVYPDLGHGFEAVLARLADAASDVVDLSAAGEIAIETVEDFCLLPPDPGRPTGTLVRSGDVASFTGWMTARA